LSDGVSGCTNLGLGILRGLQGNVVAADSNHRSLLQTRVAVSVGDTVQNRGQWGMFGRETDRSWEG
jgi:hypothetical protein